MNVSRFFIDRPIAAIVLSLLIVIAGLLTLNRLPLTEYPQVTPPTVAVRAAYPGANPKVIAETVAAPLEQEINGVDGMLYMSSQASSDGRLAVTVTFEQGVDPEIAQVEVQNRVSRAIPRLPIEVQRLGVTTQKTSPDVLMVVHLLSPGERYDLLHLSNFALLQIRDQLARLPGVGDVVVWGAGEYSLRVWLDPDKAAARSLTAGDIVAAIREQNVQVAAGTIGQPPDAASAFQLTINTTGRLADPEAFRNIVVRVGADGGTVRLGDVARVELGSNQYALRSLLDNQPAVAMQIIQDPGFSAIAVANAVRQEMARLQTTFPSGIDHRIAYDPTIFVRASIRNVIQTLFEAIVLVIIVVLFFLQTWRASIIPLVAVPVSLIGTLAVMHGLGFTLNTLSLFGLVLSIGIVVDDAIVVVENVERHLALGQSARDAASAAMREVTSPIIAITSVLVAVFVPTAFLSGLTGQFYQQFALTIAISTVLSAINSLTLSPALAAVLMQPHGARPDWLTRLLDRTLGRITRPFDRAFLVGASVYVRGVARVLRVSGIAVLLYVGLLGLSWLTFTRVPSGFVPTQDKYYLVGIAQLPSGASLDRTEALMRDMTRLALDQPGVESVVAFPGLSINGFINSPNAGVIFAMLDPFDQRRSPDLAAGAIAGALNQKLAALPGMAAVFPPPPVPGLGATGGFKLQIEDRGGQGFRALDAAVKKVAAEAARSPKLAGVFSGYQADVPQMFLDLDRERAKHLRVPLDRLFETLQVYLGSLYVNDFNFLGRTYQVTVQADAPFRREPAHIGRLQLRNDNGAMIPVSALASLRPDAGPDPVSRYNGYPSADLTGGPAPGVSSGEAIAEMQRILDANLPAGFSYEWTDLTFQQIREGHTAAGVFLLAIVLAFLILSVQYDSWTLPFSVMLVVPTVLLSALTGVWLTGGANDIFTQIGFVVLVGLAAKNSILIVEFARQREAEGATVHQAVLDACRLRLRPILMTSLAFIMGVVPLVIATGAGAEMRHAMGVAVFAGMVGVTAFGLLLTPVFYFLIRSWSVRSAAAKAASRSEARMRRMSFPVMVVTLVAAMVGAQACTTARPARTPLVQPPDRFQTTGVREDARATATTSALSTIATSDPVEVDWWRQFGDAVLDGLIAQAFAANRDIRAAAARYEASRALASAARLRQLPTGGVGGRINPLHLSEAEAMGRDLPTRTFTIFGAGAELQWEADLFGRVRTQARAAEFQAVEAEAIVRDMQVAIVGQVAAAYFDFRGAEREEALLGDMQARTTELVGLTRALMEHGRLTRVDLLRAEQVEQEIGVAGLAAGQRREAARNRIAALLGVLPQGYVVPSGALQPWTVRAIGIGEPGELLRRRPDIVAAEARIAQAMAQTGTSRAELFPRVDVSGALGLVAGSASNLATVGAGSWFIAPRLVWSVLDLPRLRRRLAAAKALDAAAAAEYERIVLGALEETETMLSACRTASATLEAQGRRAGAARTAAALVADQFREGYVDSLTRVQAERDALSAALAENQALVDQRQAIVGLYRALGGGWQAAPPPAGK